jgi:hypothetical protein
MIAGSCSFARSAIQQQTEEIAFRVPARDAQITWGRLRTFQATDWVVDWLMSRALTAWTLERGSHLQ